MQNEKRLFTETNGVQSYMYSIRNACDVIRDFLNLADSTMFISSYIANGLDNCVKEMGTAVENIKRELQELNKDKEANNE